MKSSSPPSADWRETFKALRGEFEAGAEAHPTLRHAIVQALDGERTIPPDLSREMKKAGEWRDEEWGEPWDFLDSYKDADGAYVRSLQDICAATRSFLWGGRAGIKTFESLAERAWHALPGTLKAKAQAFPQPRIPQRWLGFVSGSAVTLGNLGRLAPALMDSYTLLRVVMANNSRSVNDGEDSCHLGRGRWLL